MDLKEREFLQSVGQRVRQRREQQNLTQQQLGERSALHRTFIGSVERGERNVALLSLRKIALALRVPVAELLGDDDQGKGARP